MKKPENDKEKAYRSDLGHKAGVDRWEQEGEEAFNANFDLQKLGQAFKKSYPELREHNYLGSMATHIYLTPTLETPIFVTQTPLGTCPEILASDAILDLTGSAQEFFGRSRAKKRSGF